MEENGSKFILIESDYQGCMDKRTCKLSDEIPSNVTVLWMVEMIRHRHPSRGHANELKLTVFPLKRFKGTDNNNKREAKRDHHHPHPRSFVIRDKDYPFYFLDTGLPVTVEGLPTTSPIQKRTFDMMDNIFDHYNLPLHFNYNGNDQLNTGEFYAGGVQDIGPTVPSYPKYGNLVSPTTYQTISDHLYQPGHHIRFPTTEGITGLSESLDRVSTTPLTATHLHHHFYLNRNQIENNALKKGHLYDKHASHEAHDAYNLFNLQHLQENAGDLDNNHHAFDLQKHNFAVHNPSALNHEHVSALIKFPSGTGIPQQTYPTNQHYSQFSIPEQHQVHQHQGPTSYNIPKHYPFSEHLQISSPPAVVSQPNGYYTEPEIPLTTAAGKFYAPYHMYPANQVHSRLNQQILIHPANPTTAFHGNYQLDNNQYSEPDPIYHQQLSVLRHHLQPHLLAHHNPGYVNGNIQHYQPINVDHINNHGQLIHTPGTLDVIPLNNQGIPITSSKTPVLQTGTGGYEIPSEKLHLEPDHNGTKYDQLPSPSGADFTNSGAGDPSQGGYPDSINAQLPPPNHNEDVNVPYVDSTVVASQTSAELVEKPKPALKIRQKNRNPDTPRKKKPMTTESFSDVQTTQNTLQSTITLDQIKRLRNRGSYFQPKTTTEKAILKWMPKRTKPRTQDDLNSIAELPETANNSLPLSTVTTTSKPETPTATPDPATTTSKVFIVTPTQVVDEEESMTSISTSISYKVGDEEHRTVTSVLAEGDGQQLYNSLLPTITPGVGGVIDVAPGKLSRINTNLSTVTLFRASDKRDDGRQTSGTTIEEEQIARTILKHADGLI